MTEEFYAFSMRRTRPETQATEVTFPRVQYHSLCCPPWGGGAAKLRRTAPIQFVARLSSVYRWFLGTLLAHLRDGKGWVRAARLTG
jgi:hypothetical protein